MNKKAHLIIVRYIIILLPYLSAPAMLLAQTDEENKYGNFNSARGNLSKASKNSFNSARSNEFNALRMKLSVEYINMTRNSWRSFNSSRGIIPPHENEKPVSPIKMSDEDLKNGNKDDKEFNKIEYESVVSPTIRKGDAKPIAPIEEISEDTPSYLNFTFFNTPIKIRKPSCNLPRLSTVRENDVADMLEALNSQSFSNMLYDCIALKKEYHLDDWPFFMAMKSFSENMYSADSNESAIMTAYMLSQAGYKIRLARDDNRICVLYASKHNIYRQSFITIDNEKYYFLGDPHEQVQICPAYFSSEKPLSLWMTSLPKLDVGNAKSRILSSERYPDFNFLVTADLNLVNLLDKYPASEIGGDFMTKWAMYASVPISDNAKSGLYGKMRSLISGLSKYDAAQKILNWVQTSLTYEYDDKIWGMDRAFFAEETLYYPYADCEDRAILFTRIVRDLLGLECILVYYPGHLASAVCFNGNVDGDYIDYKGRRYIVCDPTYIGAPIGMTMPNMDNLKAKIVVL